MLYGSETWSLGLNDIAILLRTERAIVRNICGVKLMEKKSTKDLLQMLNLNETIQSIKFISRSTCTKMNKKYIFHKLTGKRWKLKLTTYKHN